jgi:hypothetical protein
LCCRRRRSDPESTKRMIKGDDGSKFEEVAGCKGDEERAGENSVWYERESD